MLWQALRPSSMAFVMPRMISSLRRGERSLLGCAVPCMIASALYGQSRFCTFTGRCNVNREPLAVSAVLLT